MRVRLRKSTHERHTFEVRRADGSTSSTDLESRSCLRHDLMHFALERRAGLRQSFYGLVAAGADPPALVMEAHAEHRVSTATEMHATEILVGMLQGAAARAVDPTAFVAKAQEYLALQGQPVPGFVTPELVGEVLAAYRTLCDRWQSLRTGGVLELDATWAHPAPAP